MKNCAAKRILTCAVMCAVVFSCVPSSYGNDNLMRNILNTVNNEAVKQSAKQTPAKPQNAKPAKQQTTTNNPSISDEQIQRSLDANYYTVGSKLEGDLCALGEKVIAYNKPVLDVKVPKKELPKTDFWDEPIDVGDTYNRVYAKGKTIIAATSGKDKHFTPGYLITEDPDYDFSGIRVGADISVIEAKIGAPLSKIDAYYNGSGQEDGVLSLDTNSFVFTQVYYDKDRKITALEHHDGYAIFGSKALAAIKKKQVN